MSSSEFLEMLRTAVEVKKLLPVPDPDQLQRQDWSLDLWNASRLVDFVKKGAYAYNAREHAAFQTPLSKDTRLNAYRDLKYLRVAVANGEQWAVKTPAISELIDDPLEPSAPVRLYLVLNALVGDDAAMGHLKRKWPRHLLMVRKIINERAQAYYRACGLEDTGPRLQTGLLHNQGIIDLYQAQEPGPRRVCSLREAFTLRSVKEARCILEDTATPLDEKDAGGMEAFLYNLAHFADDEAVTLARPALDRGARLDFRYKGFSEFLPEQVPLSSAMISGRTALALSIFSLHIEFGVPVPEFPNTLGWSIMSLQHEVLDLLINLLCDNPELCGDLDKSIMELHVSPNQNAESLRRLMNKLVTYYMPYIHHNYAQVLRGPEFDQALEQTLGVLFKWGASPVSTFVFALPSGATQDEAGERLIEELSRHHALHGTSPIVSPITMALQYDSIASLRVCIRYLEENGKDIMAHLMDPMSNMGYASELGWMQGTVMASALSLCVRSNATKCFEYLIQTFPELASEAADAWGTSLLHRACSAMPNEMLIKDAPEIPGLHSFVFGTTVDVPDAKFVRLLLEYGVDVEARDTMGFTPLFWALWRGNFAAAEMIVDHSTEEQRRRLFTPYELRGGESIFTDLIEIDIRRPKPFQQRQPTIVDSLKWLEQRGAAHAHGRYGLSPFIYVLLAQKSINRLDQLRDRAVFEYLLDLDMLSSHVNERLFHGMTLLHLAINHGNLDIVRLVLQKGVDINAAFETDGPEYAHIFEPKIPGVSEKPKPRAIELALAKAVDPNHLREAGLYEKKRAWAEAIELIALLLQHGARSEIFDAMLKMNATLEYYDDIRALGLPLAVDEDNYDLLEDYFRKMANVQLVGDWPKQLPQVQAANTTEADLDIPTFSTDNDLAPYILAALKALELRRTMREEAQKPLLAEVLGLAEDASRSSGPLGKSLLGSNGKEKGKYRNDVIFIEEKANTALHLAAITDNPKALRQMLPRFEDIDVENSEGMTPLMIAVSRAGHDESAKSSKFRLFNTPDHSVFTAQMLITAGADPNRISSEGSTPLHACIFAHDRPDIVEELVLRGADIDIRDGDGNTPLLASINEGRRKCALYLITLGADVTLTNTVGYSVLHAAATEGDEFLLSKILEWYNIERLRLRSNINVNAQTTGGHSTPLHLAAVCGHIGAMEILLNNGADTKMKNNERKTPLHLAVIGGDSDAVIKLLEAAGTELDARDDEGATPLVLAAHYYETEIQQLLVAFGADVNVLKEFQFFRQGEGEDDESIYIRIPDDGARMSADILAEEGDKAWEEWFPLVEEKFYAELEAQDQGGRPGQLTSSRPSPRRPQHRIARRHSVYKIPEYYNVRSKWHGWYQLACQAREGERCKSI
ncbi:ankyrin repeat protein [Colletotrichum tofieldiae]|nr:ankyrin repeat protein [Colletotrichum tofieldiae]GKT74787.1 ankyrin repeat protein [Colletotrichum tofieldiae]